MIRLLILLSFILGVTESIAQLDKVDFIEGSFSNGMKYPQLSIQNKTTQDSINSDIKKRISDLEASDFCIGQFGYVQKRTHLQIHIFCNCIEFENPENRYLFYNLISGTPVPYSDIIEPKKSKEFNNFILVKLFEHSSNLVLTENIKAGILKSGMDFFQTVMQRDGMDLWLPQSAGFGEEPMFLSWVELKPFLKYQFM